MCADLCVRTPGRERRLCVALNYDDEADRQLWMARRRQLRAVALSTSIFVHFLEDDATLGIEAEDLADVAAYTLAVALNGTPLPGQSLGDAELVTGRKQLDQLLPCLFQR